MGIITIKSFNVSPTNPPNVNNNQNQKNDDDFEEVKENNEKPQEEKKSGLFSLLDNNLVNLDSLGPKRKNQQSNDFKNYW